MVDIYWRIGTHGDQPSLRQRVASRGDWSPTGPGSIAPGLPDVVVGDKDRLAQVLSNILNNALKFTPPGGHVTLAASRPTRGLVRERLAPPADTAATQQQKQKRCGGGEDWVLFEVSDTGIGVPQDKLPRIFDAFYQVDPAHTKKYAGLGMGLKICHELVGSVSTTTTTSSSCSRTDTTHNRTRHEQRHDTTRHTG